MDAHQELAANTPLLPHEAAELLRITESQLLAEARRGDVPGVCLGGFWRFSRSKVLRAAASRAA